MDSKYILETEHVSKSFGSLEVLKDINLKVKKGEVICIIGPSGAGKSTYLRSLNQLEKITSGKIFIKGDLFLHRENDKTVERIAKETQKELLLEMGMCFQRFNLFPHKTVLENIMIAPIKVKNVDKETARKEALELLKSVGLEEKADEYPNRLSGGQQQRVAIARALALNPNILLCDEATSALDPNTTKSILSLLRDINKKLGITIIIVTHQMEVVKEVCNKVAILKDGKVLECGDTEELFLNHSECLKELLGEEEVVPNSGVNIKLFFPKEFSNGYIITSMARSLDIDFSIVWGKLEKFRDDVLGSLIINIPQDKKEQVINYLNLTDVKWEVLQNKENKINNKELERA